jgi:HD-like signal output (HDOD) protein
MDIKSLIDQPNKLPTIPKVTQQLIASFSSENVSIGEIVNELSSDPALSAKLLRLANSAYFHVSRTIGTVEDALRMLGFVMVRNLVVGNGMATAFRNTPGIDLHQFWRYNLYTACSSRWLASAAGVNGDMVFTLGMLHAIGQLQMHVVMPETMAPLDREMSVLAAGRAELEKKALGFHYGDVSSELAKIWNFPEPLILALQATPLPLTQEPFVESAGWVHLGAWRARTEILALNDEEIAASYPAELANRLGVERDWVPTFAAEATEGTTHAMPPLAELTEGLDAMLE